VRPFIRGRIFEREVVLEASWDEWNWWDARMYFLAEEPFKEEAKFKSEWKAKIDQTMKGQLDNIDQISGNGVSPWIDFEV